MNITYECVDLRSNGRASMFSGLPNYYDIIEKQVQKKIKFNERIQLSRFNVWIYGNMVNRVEILVKQFVDCYCKNKDQNYQNYQREQTFEHNSKHNRSFLSLGNKLCLGDDVLSHNKANKACRCSSKINLISARLILEFMGEIDFNVYVCKIFNYSDILAYGCYPTTFYEHMDNIIVHDNNKSYHKKAYKYKRYAVNDEFDIHSDEILFDRKDYSYKYCFPSKDHLMACEVKRIKKHMFETNEDVIQNICIKRNCTHYLEKCNEYETLCECGGNNCLMPITIDSGIVYLSPQKTYKIDGITLTFL